MKQEKTPILEHRIFQGEYRLLKLSAPAIGPLVKPGQFVHLRIPNLNQAVLRRPFSVYQADAEGISILYKPVGLGTDAMRSLASGDEVDLIGPLGTGFPLVGKGNIPVLIAGGYGNAALYLQAAALPVKGVAFFGGRTAEDILCVDEFKALGWDVRVTTDDGSLGTQGLVTDAFDPWLEDQEARGREQGAGGIEQPLGFQGLVKLKGGGSASLELFACGPNAMLKAIGDRATAKGITAWLSMDRNMACGVGACLTCVIKRKTKTGWEWARCCKDGPVFNAEEILWEAES